RPGVRAGAERPGPPVPPGGRPHPDRAVAHRARPRTGRRRRRPGRDPRRRPGPRPRAGLRRRPGLRLLARRAPAAHGVAEAPEARGGPSSRRPGGTADPFSAQGSRLSAPSPPPLPSGPDDGEGPPSPVGLRLACSGHRPHRNGPAAARKGRAVLSAPRAPPGGRLPGRRYALPPDRSFLRRSPPAGADEKSALSSFHFLNGGFLFFQRSRERGNRNPLHSLRLPPRMSAWR